MEYDQEELARAQERDVALSPHEAHVRDGADERARLGQHTPGGERGPELLTDLVMPDGMSGIELARLLLEEKPELKVIYTSGYSAELAAHHADLQPDSAFLPKPYRPQHLAELVRRVLDQN